MELSQAGVNACVATGLSVIQGDADIDLGDYPSDAFDYVILSQTLQETRDPRKVLRGMLRMTGNPRLVWDSYRRLIQSFAEVVAGAPREPFEAALAR